MSCTGGDRDGEFALDCSDRNRRHLAGSPTDEGTNLKEELGARRPPRLSRVDKTERAPKRDNE